jgi:hypothetical protein
VSRLLRLYPPQWRERYGDEFLALISERPPSVTDRLDVIRGAVDARLHPQLPAPPRIPDRSGLATLVGFGLLIMAGLVAANGPIRYDEYGSYREGGAALLFFLPALGLLSYGIYRLTKRVPVASIGTRSAAWLAIVAGMFWSLMPWMWSIGLIFLAAVLVFTIGARRANVISTGAVIAVAIVLAIPVSIFAAMLFLPWYAFREAGLDFSVVMVPLSGLWLLIGFRLLRGFPPPPELVAPTATL